MGTGGTRRNFTAADGVSLKEYFESRLEAVEKAMMVAAAAMDRRLEGMNEFREAMKDAAARTVTRDELCIQLRPIIEEIKELKTYKDQATGKASQSSVTASTGIAVVGLIIGLVSLASKLW